MRHVLKNTLLKSALELLSERQEGRVQKHLAECRRCRERYGDITKEIEILGSFKPELEERVPPLPRRKPTILVPAFRAAAILAIGFLIGFFASEYLRTEHVSVSPQNLITKAPSTSVAQYTSCEGVDLAIKY